MSHCCGNMPGRSIPFLVNSIYDKFPILYEFNKCICNLTSEYSFNCGFKFFFDLSDVVYTQVVYITYNMGKRDLPDIYTLARGPQKNFKPTIKTIFTC